MIVEMIKTAWHFIEDSYGVGELYLLTVDGTLIRICNDNPQQLLHVTMDTEVMEYTHIESWLSDVDAKTLRSIVNTTNNNNCHKRHHTDIETETNYSTKRRLVCPQS